MMRMFWLTLVAVSCCLVCRSQQIRDTTDPAAEKRSVDEVANSALFVNFTGAVKEVNKVWLQWDVDSTGDGDYFVIERAAEGGHYETIGALRQMGKGNHFELTDIAPPNGADFYRIKYTGQNGQVAYSKAVQLSLSGEVDFKFYPNPVDKLFIIRTEHTVDIQVIDAIGSVRVSKRLQPGIQVINVSSLERGIYILRVADKESNRVVSNQLMKN